MDELRALGLRTVPVTVIGDRNILGFNPKQLYEALQFDITVAPRDAAETIHLLGRALEAVRRAVAQMPDEKLDWTAPDRDRPMRDFGYHIFMMVQKAIIQANLRIRDIGTYAAKYDGAGRSYGSFRGIANYGASVVKEYEAWVARDGYEALCNLPSDEADLVSADELLDVVTGHTVHHLRQLYFVLEHFGISLEKRLDDAKFPPEYVMTILW